MEFTKKEIRDILIVATIVAIIFTLYELRNISNIDFKFLNGLSILISTFIFSIIIYFVYASTQKLAAKFYDYKATFGLLNWEKNIKEIRKKVSIPLGIIITLLVTIISSGRLFFVILNSTLIENKREERLGRKWTNIKEFEEAQVALAGPLSLVLLLILFKLLSLTSLVFERGMFITSTIMIFNMLPIPKVDGIKIFFGSIPLYIASTIFLILFTFLIFKLSIIQSLMLALIFALVIAGIYLYKKLSS